MSSRDAELISHVIVADDIDHKLEWDTISGDVPDLARALASVSDD